VVIGDHVFESRDVPLNSSSRVQCHPPDGAGIGGALPEQGPPGSADKNGAGDGGAAADGDAVPAPPAPPDAEGVPGWV
jgi:hypothetical protein